MTRHLPARRLGLVLLLMFLLPCLAAGQESVQTRDEWVANYRWLGAGLSTSFPYTEFGDDYSTGYGVHALLDKPVWPLINASADVGWNHFPGNEEHDSIDVWSLFFGGRLVFGVFYMGAEAGYLSEVDHVGWVPSFGCRFEKLELGIRYVASGSNSWTTLRAGYYF